MQTSAEATADIPVYVRGEFVRYVDEHEARTMISRKEVELTGHGKQRRLHLLVETAIKRERALIERDAAGAALSCTYEESLYAGKRTRDFTPPTTAYCITLKRARRHKSGVVELVPYAESEGFRRNRFNADHILRGSGLYAPRRTAGVPSFWSA